MSGVLVLLVLVVCAATVIGLAWAFLWLVWGMLCDAQDRRAPSDPPRTTAATASGPAVAAAETAEPPQPNAPVRWHGRVNHGIDAFLAGLIAGAIAYVTLGMVGSKALALWFGGLVALIAWGAGAFNVWMERRWREGVLRRRREARAGDGLGPTGARASGPGSLQPSVAGAPLSLRHAPSAGLRCLYCHEQATPARLRACASCQGTYHLECLSELGRCATIGCRHGRAPRRWEVHA